MSKIYQKEVVDFLRTTPKKMGLSEGANSYTKEIRIGAKAEKNMEQFVKVISKLKAEADKRKSDERTKGFAGIYEKIIEAEREGKVAYYKLREVMDIFASLDDYREK